MIPNPWILLAVVIALGGSYFKGRMDGIDLGETQQLRDDRIATLARDEALRVTGKAIAEIDIKQVTIKQTLEREIREKTVYADCRHSPDGLRIVNTAITGRAEPVGSGKLPRLGPTE